MLTLAHHPNRLRRADNLLPQNDGAMASRAGAIQLTSGDVLHAAPWGDRVIFSRSGRLLLWDNGETDITDAGRSLAACSFQALTQDAGREDRLYVADGVNPLWYVARNAQGDYARQTITNTVTNDAGVPYPVPAAEAVVVWRNRLWVCANSNRAQHCDNDRPDAWDPLFTQEVQTGRKDRIRALLDHGDVLALGTTQTLWGITGDSQYNFRPDKLVNERGAASPWAMASDGYRLYYLTLNGLYLLGVDKPLSANKIDTLFAAPDYSAQLALSPDGNLLLILLHGRLLVMNTNTLEFGEIAVSARGLLRLTSSVGWYGDDGVWVLGGLDRPDIAIDGTAEDVVSIYETWPDTPNPEGRALLQRAFLTVNGSDRSSATYTVNARTGARITEYTSTISMSDERIIAFSAWDGDMRSWPTQPVLREVVPRLAGEWFTHRLSASCHMELRRFDPRYTFGRG